jgi:hypothetical protein
MRCSSRSVSLLGETNTNGYLSLSLSLSIYNTSYPSKYRQMRAEEAAAKK